MPNPSRIYYFEAPQSGEFTYGSETLKRGTNVQYPIGTTQVSVATACDQDGLGNADGSLIKKKEVFILSTKTPITDLADQN